MKVELNKSFRERFFHAVLFEVLANVLITFSVAHFLRVTLTQSAALSVTSAVTATVWNYLFNYVFDRVQKKYQFQRTLWVRALHAVIFEAGLIIILIPVCMYFLYLPFQQAIYVETGLVLFFLPYTLLFNLIYDYLRWQLIGKHGDASNDPVHNSV
ncbi:hypothetical protein AE02_05265 [Klebsiella variicola]|nr:PACE efflux transporter [Klebsiella variicola]KDL89529.1 hypothetical protein AE02_05265 [Klebsiella variicola]